MEIFRTNRLIVKPLEENDKAFFIELLSEPKIIEPIPQAKLPKEEVLKIFAGFVNFKGNVLEKEKLACGIFEIGNPELIGLCLFLVNEEKEKELGYRFRPNYWRKGYGTEITAGTIDYYLKELGMEKITADVNIKNIGSVKILSKFMNPVREYFCEEADCMIRRYEIDKEDWLQAAKINH